MLTGNYCQLPAPLEFNSNFDESFDIPLPEEHENTHDMIATGVENLDPQYGCGRTEVYVL